MPSDTTALRRRAIAPALAPGLRRLAREPLLHFAILGTLIFGADALLHPPARNDHVIVVTRALRQSFIDNFSEDHDQTPTAQQLQQMTDAWVASEILYREGKAAGVDRGDQTIRDRIAYKLQLLIFDQIKVDRPTRTQLEAWFAGNHARFDEPERVGFYIAPPTDQANARRELAEIQAHQEDPRLRDQTRALLARPIGAVASSFGAAFLHDLLATPIGQWTVLHSTEGWHLVRLDSHRPGKLAKLDDVIDDATRIWHDDAVRIQAWEAVRRLKTSYTVKIDS